MEKTNISMKTQILNDKTIKFEKQSQNTSYMRYEDALF
jgi:hypothetical protein